MNKSVLLGMSGGIDSSVAALLLKEKGFQVSGITFIFSGNDDSVLHHSAYAAKLLADKLGIEHHIVDLRDEFESTVIRYFIYEYKIGNTPFPCAVCNPLLKFFNLEKYAKNLFCDYIATGHYVNTVQSSGIKFISAGADKNKDQSFFLWGLKQQTINKLIFPLGGYAKKEVFELARAGGFKALTDRNESQGICFIPGRDYRNFLNENGLKSNPGNFIDQKGRILGKHNGIFNYTIGQRRKLGIHLNKPVFVSEIRSTTNEVVLSPFDDMYRSRIYLKHIHFVYKKEPENGKIYCVKIRYRLQQNECKVTLLSENTAIVELVKPVAMVANGQTAVIYDGSRVIGGGFIMGSA